MTRLAVVTIARGRHEHLALQHESLRRARRRPEDYVLVAMDDDTLTAAPGQVPRRVIRTAVDLHGLPLARARNLGIDAAFCAGAEVVVCLDADCLASEELVGAYADVVARRPDTIW